MLALHDNHYMHFTSLRFALGIRIPQRRVGLEVGFLQPCCQALRLIFVLILIDFFGELVCCIFTLFLIVVKISQTTMEQ